MARMYDRPTLGPDGWIIDETPTPNPVYVEAQTDPLTGGIGLSAAGGLVLPSDIDPLAVAHAGREFHSMDAVTTANSGTAATVTIDASSPLGVPALKIAAPSGNVWAEVGISTLNIPNFAENGDRLVWLIWIEDATKVGKVWSYAGTAGYGRYVQINDYYLNDSIEYLHNGVHCIAIHPGNASTNTLQAGDAITDAKLRFFATTSQAFNAWVLGVYVPVKSKPFVTLTFDDNSASFRTFASIMESHGLRGTFGLNNQNIGTNDTLYVNWGDVDALIAAGHQVVSHNIANSKYITTQTLTQYMVDYRATRNTLIGRGYGRAGVQQYHPYVQGGHDPELIAAMQSEGARFARTVKSANCELFGRQYCPHIIPTREFTNTVSLAQMTTWLNQAETYGQDMWVMGHLLHATSPGATIWLTADFEAFCADVAARIRAGTVMGAGTVAQWARLRGLS
jgi:hypothetical protein